MGVGIPAVMAAVGTNLEIVEQGKNGFLAHNEEEWFEQLSHLIESAELRQSIGAEGRKSLEKRYSRQAWATKWVSLLSRI